MKFEESSQSGRFRQASPRILYSSRTYVYCSGYRSLEFVMEPNLKEGIELTVEISTLSFQGVEDQQTRIKPHKKAKNEDAEQNPHYWIGEVQIDSKLEAYRKKFIGVITAFKSIGNGHPSRISVAKNCIELTSDNYQPYTWHLIGEGLRP